MAQRALYFSLPLWGRNARELDRLRVPVPQVLPDLSGLAGLPAAEHRMPNIEHRTSNTEHRTPNTEHRTPNIEHRTSNAEHRMPNIGCRTPNTEHRMPDIECRTLNTESGCSQRPLHPAIRPFPVPPYRIAARAEPLFASYRRTASPSSSPIGRSTFDVGRSTFLSTVRGPDNRQADGSGSPCKTDRRPA
jgi:hypothetical protein